MKVPRLAWIPKLFVQHPAYAAHLCAKKIRLFKRYQWVARRKNDPAAIVPPPLAYAVVLTWRCNLHCIQCMQWGKAGWIKSADHQLQTQELSWPILRKLVEDTSTTHPFYIFLGGEPLLYPHFGELAELLRSKKVFGYICTNGTSLDRWASAIEHNPYLVFTVALDGLEKTNDKIRGAGVYEKVTRNIRLLKSLRRPAYVGIEHTVLPENTAGMHEFCAAMAKTGVDWVVFNLLWFISDSQARHYETVMQSHFGVSPTSHRGYRMPYPIDRAMFIEQYRRIESQRWPMQVSWQPHLADPRAINAYIDTPEIPTGADFCYKPWVRMDVTPDAKVVETKHFPDLVLGDLQRQDMRAVWNGEPYRHFRKYISQQLLPVCSRCSALYGYNAKRIML